MIPGWPVPPCRQRFKAIFESLVIVDLWVLAQVESGQSLTDLDCDWRSPFLAIAAASAKGACLGTQPWKNELRHLARQSESALLLAVLPILLLYSDTYGHQRPTLQQWAQTMGLTAVDILSLDRSFQHLCLTMAPPPPWSIDRQRCWLQLPDPKPATVLQPVEQLLTASQGQFLPALQLAHRHHRSAVTLTLVGVLVAWGGGLAALPSQLRYHSRRSPRLVAWWGPDYSNRLSHLAEALHSRWAGVQPGNHQDSSLVVR